MSSSVAAKVTASASPLALRLLPALLSPVPRTSSLERPLLLSSIPNSPRVDLQPSSVRPSPPSRRRSAPPPLPLPPQPPSLTRTLTRPSSSTRQSEPYSTKAEQHPLKPRPHSPLILFIVQAFIIVGLSRLLHLGLRYLRQPRVISEVVAGILVGPSALGRVPGFTSNIFPPASIPYVSLVANIGLCLCVPAGCRLPSLLPSPRFALAPRPDRGRFSSNPRTASSSSSASKSTLASSGATSPSRPASRSSASSSPLASAQPSRRGSTTASSTRRPGSTTGRSCSSSGPPTPSRPSRSWRGS